jgi:hypothetical protein
VQADVGDARDFLRLRCRGGESTKDCAASARGSLIVSAGRLWRSASREYTHCEQQLRV